MSALDDLIAQAEAQSTTYLDGLMMQADDEAQAHAKRMKEEERYLDNQAKEENKRRADFRKENMGYGLQEMTPQDAEVFRDTKRIDLRRQKEKDERLWEEYFGPDEQPADPWAQEEPDLIDRPAPRFRVEDPEVPVDPDTGIEYRTDIGKQRSIASTIYNPETGEPYERIDPRDLPEVWARKTKEGMRAIPLDDGRWVMLKGDYQKVYDAEQDGDYVVHELRPLYEYQNQVITEESREGQTKQKRIDQSSEYLRGLAETNPKGVAALSAFMALSEPARGLWNALIPEATGLEWEQSPMTAAVVEKTATAWEDIAKQHNRDMIKIGDQSLGNVPEKFFMEAIPLVLAKMLRAPEREYGFVMDGLLDAAANIYAAMVYGDPDGGTIIERILVDIATGAALNPKHAAKAAKHIWKWTRTEPSDWVKRQLRETARDLRMITKDVQSTARAMAKSDEAARKAAEAGPLVRKGDELRLTKDWSPLPEIRRSGRLRGEPGRARPRPRPTAPADTPTAPPVTETPTPTGTPTPEVPPPGTGAAPEVKPAVPAVDVEPPKNTLQWAEWKARQPKEPTPGQVTTPEVKAAPVAGEEVAPPPGLVTEAEELVTAPTPKVEPTPAPAAGKLVQGADQTKRNWYGDLLREPKPAKPTDIGEEVIVHAGEEMRPFPVKAAKVDIDELVVSPEPGPFQNRDLGLEVERLKVKRISDKPIRKHLEDVQLGADKGAPIVWIHPETKLAYVVSGNGRVLAMRQSGKFKGGIKVRILQGDQDLAEALVPLAQETTAGKQTLLTKARGMAQRFKLTDEHLPTSAFREVITGENVGRFLKENPAFARALSDLPRDPQQAADMVRHALAGMLPENVQALAETFGETGARMFMEAAPGLLALRQLAKTNKNLARFDVLEDFSRAAKFLEGVGRKKLTPTQLNRLLEQLATETDLFEETARKVLGGLKADDIAHIIGINAQRGLENPGKALSKKLAALYESARGARTKGFAFDPSTEAVYRQLWKKKIGDRAEAIAEKLKGVVEGPKPAIKPPKAKVQPKPKVKAPRPATQLSDKKLFEEVGRIESTRANLGTPRHAEVVKELGRRGRKKVNASIDKAVKKKKITPARAELYKRINEDFADEVFFSTTEGGFQKRTLTVSMRHKESPKFAKGHAQYRADAPDRIYLGSYTKQDHLIKLYKHELPTTFVHEMAHAGWYHMLRRVDRDTIAAAMPSDFKAHIKDLDRRASEYFSKLSEQYFKGSVPPDSRIAKIIQDVWGKIKNFAKWAKDNPDFEITPAIEKLLDKVMPGVQRRKALAEAPLGQAAPRVKPHVRAPGEIEAGVKPGPYKPAPSVGAGPGAGRPVKTVQAIGESIQRATGVALRLGVLSKAWVSKGAQAVYEGVRGVATIADTRAAAKAMREAKQAIPKAEREIKRAVEIEARGRLRVQGLKKKVADLRKAEHRELDAARVERELNVAGRELTKARAKIKEARAGHAKLQETIRTTRRQAKLYSTRESSRRLLAMVHESGHHLSKTKKIVEGLTEAQQKELRFMAIEAYDPEHLAGLSRAEMADESFAEAFAQWVVNDDLTMYTAGLQKELKSIFKGLDGVDEIKGSVRDFLRANADEIYESYRGQFTRSLSDVLEEKGGVKGAIAKAWRTAWTVVQDKYAPIERIFNSIGADPHALKIMRFVEGTSGSRAQHFIQHGVLRTATGTEIRVKGLMGIKKDLGGAKELDELINYIHNKRSLQIRESGFNVVDEKVVSEEFVRRFEAQTDAKWKKAADDYLEWNDAALGYARDAGIVSPEAYQAMRWMDPATKKQRRFYIPFHKDLSASGRHGKGGNLDNPFRHRIKGSLTGEYKERLLDLMEHTEKIVMAADRAMVTKNIVHAIEAVPGLGRFARPVGTATEVAPGMTAGVVGKKVAKFMEDMEASLRAQGLTTANAINDDVKTLMLNIEALQGNVRSDIVMLYHEGKMIAYEMAPELVDAFRSVPVQMEGALATFVSNLAKVARVPVRAIRAGTVEYNPGFMFVNAIRDGFTVVAKEGFAGVGMLARGYGKTIQLRTLQKFTGKKYWSDYNKTLMEAFDAAGLSSSGFSGSTVRHSKAAYRQLMNDSLWRKTKNVVGSYRELLATTELAPRIGAFESELRRLGWRGGFISSVRFLKAAEKASEITVNFRRGGHFTRMLNQFVPFLNANIQGVGNFGRYYKSFGSAKAWKDGSNYWKLGRAAVTITTAELASHQFHKGKTWYKALPEYEKDLYWFIEGDEGTIYRIPKPFEWGWAFGTQFRKIAENGMGTKGFNAWADSAVKTFFPQTMMPTAIEIPFTLATSYDFFREQYLTSPFKLAGDKRLQYNKWTPETYKKASAYFGGLSPVQIEYLVNTMSGGMAKEGHKLYEMVDRWIHGAGDYNAFQRSGANVGFAGRFLVRRGTPQHQVKIWDTMKKLEADRALSGNPNTFDRSSQGALLKYIKRWHRTRGKALRNRIEKEGEWGTAVALWNQLAKEAAHVMEMAEAVGKR